MRKNINFYIGFNFLLYYFKNFFVSIYSISVPQLHLCGDTTVHYRGAFIIIVVYC